MESIFPRGNSFLYLGALTLSIFERIDSKNFENLQFYR